MNVQEFAKEVEAIERFYTFICLVCGRHFSAEVWECPRCAHHWPLTNSQCGNCQTYCPYPSEHVLRAYQQRVEQLENQCAILAAEVDRLMAEKGEQV